MSRSEGSFAFLPFSAWLVLLIGATANAALFAFVSRLEDRREESKFEELAMRRFSAIEIGVNNALEANLSINRWFEMIDRMDDAKFRTFVDPVLQSHPYFVSFGYQAIVRGADRAAFEARVRRHRPGFAIRDRLPDGSLAAAKPADSYRVIEHIHPLIGNEVLHGFNTRVMDVHNDAAARATASDGPASTRLFGLLQFDDRPQGFLIMSPVHRKPAPGALAGKRGEIAGFTVAAFIAPELFRKILAAAHLLDDPGMSVSVYADAPNPFELPVYRNAGPAPAEDVPGLCRLLCRPEHEFSRRLRIADADWRIGVSGRAQSCTKTHTGSLLLLAAGSVLSMMAAGYLTALHRRAQQLARLNTLLAHSTQRFRHLVDMSSDWYWEQDAQFRFTLMAGRVAPDHSRLKESILGKTRWELAPSWFSQEKMAEHRAVLETRLSFRNFEYPVLTENGNAMWLNVNGEPLFDGEGRFTGYRGTSKDITSRKRSEYLLRQLTEHREAIKEQERKRIAREIHDELGQTLLAVRLDVSMLHERTRRHARIHARSRLALQQIDSAMAAMRAIINDLRSPVLDLGIDAAIEWQVRQFSQRTGIACELLWNSDAIALDEHTATALFRIVQEALNNVLKHACARRVRIALSATDRGLTMRIADDGVGAQECDRGKPNAFGLAGIGERVVALGGRFDIVTAPGQGMELIVQLPAPNDGAGSAAAQPDADASLLRFVP